MTGRLVPGRLVPGRLVIGRLVTGRLVIGRLVTSRVLTGRVVTGRLVLTRLSFKINNDLSTCTVTATAALPVGQLVSQQESVSVRQTDTLTFCLTIYEAA